MKTHAIIFFILSFISLIIALIIFSKGLDVKAILFLIFLLVAVLFFRQGIKEIKKK